jgi:hypothetical protein
MKIKLLSIIILLTFNSAVIKTAQAQRRYNAVILNFNTPEQNVKFYKEAKENIDGLRLIGIDGLLQTRYVFDDYLTRNQINMFLSFVDPKVFPTEITPYYTNLRN